MRLRLKVWRQAGPSVAGRMVEYDAYDISPDMSFLEMLDVVNERLITAGDEPIAFDHDCREGICGSCALMINGAAHGPMKGTATCQLHMRSFKDGDTIIVEPWRAKAFPVIRDLIVDRGALDRIIQDSSVRQLAPRRMRMPSSYRRLLPMQQWTQPRASVVARVSPRVRTHRRLCSLPRR
jgi:succinate dehydrogenase/fumarate reductase-like Fe-S protein